jgi:hypothetical protein
MQRFGWTASTSPHSVPAGTMPANAIEPPATCTSGT